MFTPFSFNKDELYLLLKNDFDFIIEKNSVHSFRTIRNVKADFISHQCKIVIHPVVSEDETIMLSLPDIAAMKLNAITFSGTRLKDFADIYFLLEKFLSNKCWIHFRKI